MVIIYLLLCLLFISACKYTTKIAYTQIFLLFLAEIIEYYYF